MYRRPLILTAAAAVAWLSLATGDPLARADERWEAGDYIAALTDYQQLLNGPEAGEVLEPIALTTGELFRTIELTADGANPVFASDSKHFSFETGSGVTAGTASGIGRVTHVRATGSPATDVTMLDGGDASFCPDVNHVAFLRVAA